MTQAPLGRFRTSPLTLLMRWVGMGGRGHEYRREGSDLELPLRNRKIGQHEARTSASFDSARAAGRLPHSAHNDTD
jgi:hypothetical protein